MIRTLKLSGVSIGLVLPALPAWAHAGHLGELAGHGHWIALGAAVGAMAIGAGLAKWRKAGQQSEEPEVDEDCEAEETEAQASA
ncbi:MAG: DUF6732 family protein [Pseudomonadota bacterium]